MSRSIDIGYRDSSSGQSTNIDIRPPYILFGTQNSSMKFWSNPRLQEFGIHRLAVLGVSDPVYFIGWDMMAELAREIDLLLRHLPEFDFDVDVKASWVSHLVYCYLLLIQTAPRDSIPELTIG